MRMTACLALIPALIAASAAVAAPRDQYPGDYAGECRTDKAQCALEVSMPNKAKEYKVQYVVADRFDFGKKLCVLDGVARKDPSGRFLRGTFKQSGMPFDIFPARGGQIEMQAAVPTPCDQLGRINGLYDPVGD